MITKTEIITAENLPQCCEILAARDTDLAKIYRVYGAPPLWKREATFATLVHIILEQQVSLASALSAYRKLEQKIGTITPENLLILSDEEMKAVYFSRQKTIYARDLATAIIDGKLDLAVLENLPDEAVKSELKKIKGIGEWTAGIYLLMALMRRDVMPKGDLALHVAWQKLTGAAARPNSDDFLIVAEKWKPLRAVAARLLWHYYLSEKALPAKKADA